MNYVHEIVRAPFFTLEKIESYLFKILTLIFRKAHGFEDLGTHVFNFNP